MSFNKVLSSFKGVLFGFVVIPFVACSGGGGGVVAVSSYDDLGKCSSAMEGTMRLVSDENQQYRCVDGYWEKYTLRMGQKEDKTEDRSYRSVATCPEEATYCFNSFEELAMLANCNAQTDGVEAYAPDTTFHTVYSEDDEWQMPYVKYVVYTCMPDDESRETWSWTRACEYKGRKYRSGDSWDAGGECQIVPYRCVDGFAEQYGGHSGWMCYSSSSY